MTPIDVEESDAARIKKLVEKEAAVRAFVQMVTQQGEARIMAIREDGQQVWSDVARKYGIDIENISWVLSNDGKRLLPIQARFNHA